MTRQHLIAVVVAVLLAALDGYDVQAMSFVAPVVSKAWNLDKATLGLVLASSLFGMAGGSLGLSPLADVIGRRPTVLAGLLLMTVGSLLSGLSHGIGELAASRALTGLGIGVIVPLTAAIAAEFSSTRHRGFAVATTTVGFSLGGVSGGLLAAVILKAHAWLWVFVFGAAAGALLLFLTAFALPESPSFLGDRRPDGARQELDGALLRLEKSPGADLRQPVARRRKSYRALFSAGMVSVTIRFAIVYILIVTAAYYLLSWLPQLVADVGFPPSTASLVAAISTLVGVAAGLIFGALAARIGSIQLASGAMVGFGIALAVLGSVRPVLSALLLAASACSFFLSAATAVFYASMTEAFPPTMRVSGIGLVMGVGRLLSGLGPYVAGIMFAGGFTRSGVSMVFAAVAASGGLLLATGRRRASRPRDV